LTWSAIPAGQASVRIGSGWLASLRSPILLVPSVIVPEELTALVNPRHPVRERITAQAVRRFEYNRLFTDPKATCRLTHSGRSESQVPPFIRILFIQE
jgi:hypothetical protein